MKHYLLLATLAFTAGCTAEKSEQTDTNQEPETTEIVQTTACYTSVMGQDTMLLQLENLGGKVTGNLAYNFYEKDDNTGTLRGEMHGDTLLADYSFMSEGTESVRQMAFLKKGDDFVEGYGDAEDRDGKMVFKNTTALDFNSGTVFTKVPCTD